MGALEINEGATALTSTGGNEEVWESFRIYWIGGVGISGVGRLWGVLLRAVSKDWKGSSIADEEDRPYRKSLSSALLIYVSDPDSDPLCLTFVPVGTKDNEFVFKSPSKSQWRFARGADTYDCQST